ncbi:hypothetical protein BLNAU_8705 [Blattamonas nauphoetae]|uniref:Uncharacterized protein n=1 Tax=Blattamonas nauphoetae TaxID=2049346 RepID=A0ABQ9XY24_9EUKA|nr:hypothetical protein BLNAU_8705 [Blattamonas nauphoetae]
MFSSKAHHTLVKADLIPQLIVTLNPQSVSLAETEEIHTCLLQIITDTFWLLAPESLQKLEIEESSEQQNVHETVLKQILAPSEQDIRHLCVHRYSRSDC